MYKKLLTVVVCGLCFCFTGESPVDASERMVRTEYIPQSAPANALIEYESDGSWKILDSTSYSPRIVMKSNNNSIALSLNKYSKAIDSLTFNKSDSLKCSENDSPVYDEILPDPETGMRVLYDNWGEIEKIYILKDNEYKEVSRMMFLTSGTNQTYSTLSSYNPLPKGTRKAPGTYRYGTVEPKTESVLGIKKNVIKITENSVTGKGDLTVYPDLIGDNSNTLQKGDCATKGEIDNPKDKTKIKVTNKLNNVTAEFVKQDNGDLPNAVIDIWKTGVEKLGIKSNNYNNIKQAVVYTYDF